MFIVDEERLENLQNIVRLMHRVVYASGNRTAAAITASNYGRKVIISDRIKHTSGVDFREPYVARSKAIMNKGNNIVPGVQALNGNVGQPDVHSR